MLRGAVTLKSMSDRFKCKSVSVILRILATLDAKTAKISNFCTFWPVI